MDSDISQAFQKELTCWIFLTYLTDPVTIDCGHSFCRPCLYLCWEAAPTPAKCPICRETSQCRDFKTNILVKNLVSYLRQANVCQFLSSEEHMCGTHKEARKIFCEEDKNLLCLLCSKTQEHETHKRSPIEGAAEDYREKLLKQMGSLWKEIRENQRNLKEKNTITDEWMDYVHIRRLMIKSVCKILHPDLHEEEKQHLEKLTQEGKNILQQLKDLGDTLTRSESVQLCMPQPVSPELSAGPITGLTDRLSRYRVNISFHDKTTNHNIKLFDDVRSWRGRRDHRGTSVRSEGSNCFATWGTVVLTSGKHYWELDVDDSWDWALGVCSDSWIRRDHTLVGSEDIFLLLCVKEHDRYSLFTTAPVLCQYLQKPHGWVGVFLDCETGSVTFLNVAQSTIIWTYPNYSFNFPFRSFLYAGRA